MANHKYIERKWVNGRWEYKYRTDEKSSDQLRRDTEREKAYRERMIKQSYRDYDNLSSRWVKDPEELKANDRAWNSVRRNNGLYSERFHGLSINNAIVDPDSKQKELEYAYKHQSLGTKIKADARSAADDAKARTKAFKDAVSKSISDKKDAVSKSISDKKDAVSKAISDKKAHNLMLKQNKEAAKKAAKSIEKFSKSTGKISSLAPHATDTGKTAVSKILDKFKKK